jgi:hypothetical protein
MPREIIIPKLMLNDQEIIKSSDTRGAIFIEDIPEIRNEDIRKKLQLYISKP